MKKLFFAFTLFAATMTITSCNKNQKAVKKLEGDWEQVSVDGVTVPDSSKITLHFELCKLKKDEWCEMSSTEADGTSSGTYFYKVTNDGEYLTQKISDPTKGTIEMGGNIVELTDDKLILEVNFLGAVTSSEYKKK